MIGFAFRTAWRQGRALRGKLILLTAPVIAGVAALVAINSFTDNVAIGVAAQARELLGADLTLTSSTAIDNIPIARRLIDSLQRGGGEMVRVAHAVDFTAMAYRAGANASAARLVKVRSVDPDWPFFGAVTTSPAAVWHRLQRGDAIVDPSLLSTINARIGDTLALGDGRFPIVGTVVNVPGDVGLQLAFGPRVFIATSSVAATHLLTFGSRARYQTALRLPASIDADRVKRANADALRPGRVTLHTVADDRDSLTRQLRRLGDYLGLLALAALLLGGLGVASATQVTVRQQLPSLAILRSLGATSGQLIVMQLLQTVAMAAAGSIVGVVLGIGLQQVMPWILHDFVPVSVTVGPSARAIAIGGASGIWTAIAFTLLPVLAVRDVPPLASLRHGVVPLGRRWNHWRVGALVVTAGSVVGLATIQLGSFSRALWFCVALAFVLALLWLAAILLIVGARRLMPARSPFLWRQGVANLHRPANQTHSVVVALGFGTLILATLFTVQRNLIGAIAVPAAKGSANLVLFDIQSAQRNSIDSMLHADRLASSPFIPIVPMRMTSLNGVSVSAILAHTRQRGRTNDAVPPPWTLRREYRSTYRALNATDKLVAGSPFSRGSGSGRTRADPVEISVESGLAGDLKIGVGDTIAWDVQGIPVYSRVVSLREVTWARFEPNFFVIFAPGALELAPQSWLTMVSAPDAATRGQVEREIAEHVPNVTAIDLDEILRAVGFVTDRILVAIRFLAIFSLATGVVVLIGAIAISRWQRMVEGTLFRALGATRRQVLTMLAVEYAALGLGAAIAGAVLAGVGGWAVSHWLLHIPFELPVGSLLMLAVVAVLLTTIVGLWSSFDVLNRPPLEVLRTE